MHPVTIVHAAATIAIRRVLIVIVFTAGDGTSWPATVATVFVRHFGSVRFFRISLINYHEKKIYGRLYGEGHSDVVARRQGIEGPANAESPGAFQGRKGRSRAPSVAGAAAPSRAAPPG